MDVLIVRMDEIGILSAGVKTEVQCTIWGSYPPPMVSWTLRDKPLIENNMWVSEDGNRTISVVSLTPSAIDDESVLRCAAHNPVIMSEISNEQQLDTYSDAKILTVNYPPQVAVSLGRSLDATNIKEGDDLYIECSAAAKPPPHKVTWRHNGKDLMSGNGILVSNMTLVLQHVARANAGNYTCHATNTEGFAASEPLALDVKYAPVCASSVASQHSVAKHENARISCNVLANPPVVQFSWAFNNTAEAVSVPDDRYVVQGTESVVNYTPVTELDYGTLLCWATNGIGQQIQPCVFQIIAAGKPDPPHNCRAFDVTISSLQVSCLPGDDGGLGQTFILQVLEVGGGYETVAEVRRESASFSVANLRPATSYRLLVTAVNSKGESRPAELRAYTVALNHPQHENPAEPTRERESGSEVAVGVLVGAILACLPVAIIVIILGVRSCLRVRASERRRSSRSEESEKDTSSELEGKLTGKSIVSQDGRLASTDEMSIDKCSDIPTITGGPGLAASTSISSRLSPHQMHQHHHHHHHHPHHHHVPATNTSGVLYPCGQIYTQEPTCELGVHVIKGSASAKPLKSYVPEDKKGQGEKDNLIVTVPPPEAYGKGYQTSESAYRQTIVPSYYTSQDQSSPRLKQGYDQQLVFQEGPPQGVVERASHLHSTGYNPLQRGTISSIKTTSCINSGETYQFPQNIFQERSHGNPEALSYATLPLRRKDISVNKTAEENMSTVYNPLVLFPSCPRYLPPNTGCGVNVNERHLMQTGSLKRQIKPTGQDIQRIKGNSRNRSASLSSERSKRESSV